MDNIPAPENIVSREKVSKKSPLLKILIPLILLLILGGLGFVFRDKVLTIIGFKKETLIIDEQTQAENNLQSPFNDLIASEGYYNDEDSKYLKIYEDYYLGYVGQTFDFSGFNEDDFSISLKKIDTENVQNFSLSDGFLIVCTNFGVGRVMIDFSGYNNSEKILIAKKASNLSLDRKIELIKNYPEGSGVGVILESKTSGVDQSDDLVVRRLLLQFSNPELCTINE